MQVDQAHVTAALPPAITQLHQHASGNLGYNLTGFLLRSQSMDVVSLVVSIFAILISSTSVWYVRASAKANQGQLKLALERSHTERTPRLLAEYHVAEGQHEGIRLINAGPVDLSEVSIEVAADANPIISGLAGAKLLEHIGPWAVGDGDSFVMNRVSEQGGSITLRCTCVAAGDETWTVFVLCEVPSTPPRPFAIKA